MRRRSLVAGLGLALGAPALAQAQAGRPVRLIVTLAPGSAIDIAARLMAPHVAAALGQTVIVENRVGADGAIGMTEMLRAPPDGNTLFLGSQAPLAINVALVKNLPYDPRRDLAPISGAFTATQVLVVKSDFPARTLTEFIEVARQRRGSISIGHATTLVQVQIATLARMADIALLPVPYRGTPATITDVLGGTLDATILDPANALANVNSGKMRALGITSAQRSPLMPDWPAIAETLPGFDFTAWTAVVGQRALPHDTVTRLTSAVTAALRAKEVSDRMERIGFVPWFIEPDTLAAYIDSETTRWLRIARENNLQPA
jgi:tripartite-type tricarboxylate transporter receptor subunit TctC